MISPTTFLKLFVYFMGEKLYCILALIFLNLILARLCIFLCIIFLLGKFHKLSKQYG